MKERKSQEKLGNSLRQMKAKTSIPKLMEHSEKSAKEGSYSYKSLP